MRLSGIVLLLAAFLFATAPSASADEPQARQETAAKEEGIKDPRITVITLGVHDLATMTAFYRDTLGWAQEPSPPSISFFDLGGLVLGLYPHAELADDITVQGEAPSGAYHGFTFAHNLASREAVDALFAELEAKGVTILKAPQAVFWGGYSGYFADPEGNAWEVAHNPMMILDAEGRFAGQKTPE